MPIQNGMATLPGDALDGNFYMFDENTYAKSGQLEAAENAERRTG